MAPFAHRVTRATIQGTFGGGVEEWSTGFYIGYEGGDADMPTQQLADDVAAAWRNFMIAPGAQISGMWEATAVKLSSVGTDGKSNAADTVYANFSAVTKGTASQHFPPQVSLVCTMHSTIARGVGSKGRMYLPGVAASIDGTGKIPAGFFTGFNPPLKAFFNAVNASTATDNVVVLASHGSLNADGTPKVGGSAPIIKAVTGIKLGNVYDTQRRRRNGLQEQYITVPL